MLSRAMLRHESAQLMRKVSSGISPRATSQRRPDATSSRAQASSTQFEAKQCLLVAPVVQSSQLSCLGRLRGSRGAPAHSDLGSSVWFCGAHASMQSAARCAPLQVLLEGLAAVLHTPQVQEPVGLSQKARRR